MNKTSATALFACLVWCAEVMAQGQPATQFGGYAGSSTQSLFSSGNFTSSASIPPQYRSGKYIHLEAALVALLSADQELTSAFPGKKREYLPRSILGVQQAIADVKLAMDTAAGRPTPAPPTLPSLPAGVGNASSGMVVMPTTTPKIPSPAMEAALLALATARDELARASPSDKGIFLPRAMADVTFAMDNANAAINLVNDLPAVVPTPPPAPARAPATAPGMKNNQQFLWAALAVLVVLVAIGVELLVRKRSGT